MRNKNEEKKKKRKKNKKKKEKEQNVQEIWNSFKRYNIHNRNTQRIRDRRAK